MSTYQFVCRMVDEMPRNAVIQKNENESKQGGTGCHDGDPAFAIQITEIDQPRATSSRICEIQAIFRPAGIACFGTASKCWRNRAWNVEGLEWDMVEGQSSDQRPNQDGRDHGKIRHRVSEALRRQKWGELGASETKGHLHGANADQQRQQSGCRVRVVVFYIVLLVRLVIALKVIINSGGGKRTTQSVDDKDGGNEQGKDLVREPRRVGNDPIQGAERGQAHVEADPESNPGVEGQKGDAHALGHFEENLCKGQHRSRSTVDHHGLPADESVDDATPRGRHDHFHRSNPVFRGFAVHRTKGDGGSDAGKEKEEGDGDRFLIKVRHFLVPVCLQATKKRGRQC